MRRNFGDGSTLGDEDARCPFCDSTNTRIEQRKGTSICRTVHYCEACNEPFEQLG